MPKPTLSAIRAKAGRKGAKARWAKSKGRELTHMARLYASDCQWLAARAPTIARAVRALREEVERKEGTVH